MPPIEVLREFYTYDPLTGVITKIKGKNKGPTSRQASKRGYLSVSFTYDGIEYRIPQHRLAWVLANGDIPCGLEIDHINRDKTDNNLDNLRLATSAQNKLNRGRKDELPRRGVGQTPYGWTARYRNKLLGHFYTFEEAVEAREKAEENCPDKMYL
jgi:hypothetical protein